MNSHHIILSLLSFLFVIPVWGQDEWKLSKEKNGVTVYTRKVEGEVLKEYRAEMLMKADIENVISFFRDIDNNTLWMNSVKSCEMIKEVNENEYYYYSEIDTPWPMANRDMVVHVTIEPTEDGYICHLDNASEYVPPKESFVRIPNFRGKLIMTQTQEGQVQIIEQSWTNPGGNVPGWLANNAVTEGPVKALGKLRTLTEE